MEVNFCETLKYKDHLYKFVRVNAKKVLYEGWIKAIDPLSGNLILVTLNEKKSEVIKSVLIMGQAISSIVVLESDDEVSNLVRNVSLVPCLPPLNVTVVKEHLLNWIKLHRLPVKENADGSIEVLDSVTVNPPYRPEDCISSNGRILSKVTDMIKNMPSENVSSSTENKSEQISN